LRSELVYLVFLLPLALLYLGASIVWDPYTTVPDPTLVVASHWDPGIGEERPAAYFTIRSRGVFTTNYPITIDVSVTLPKRTAEFCQGKKIWIHIPGTRQNQRDPNTVRILMREVPGDGDARSGGETVIFPYPGYFTYQVMVGNESSGRLFFPVDKESIFAIENYSARLQIENTNRTFGIALASLSIAALGIMVKPFSDHMRTPRLKISSVKHSSPEGVGLDGRPGRRVFYRISVRNERRFWMVNSVQRARITMIFLAREGAPPREVLRIPAKWDFTPQPIAPGSYSPDLRLFPETELLDINPRLDESFCLCMKFEGEDDVYAFNAHSYFFPGLYRNPDFRLGKGEYLVRVILNAANAYKEFSLLLRNNGPNFKDVTIEVQK